MSSFKPLELAAETWHDVPHLPTIQASSLGRVRRVWPVDGEGVTILQEQYHGNKAIVGIALEYGLAWYPVENLVMYSQAPVICFWHGVKHLDGKQGNNRLANLDWYLDGHEQTNASTLKRLVEEDYWQGIVERYLEKPPRSCTDIALEFCLEPKKVRQFVSHVIWRAISYDQSGV